MERTSIFERETKWFQEAVNRTMNFYLICGYSDFPDVFDSESDWNKHAANLIQCCDSRRAMMKGGVQ